MQKGPGASTNVLMSRKTKSTNQVVEKGYHCIPSYILSPCVIVEDFRETSCFVGNKQQS